MNNNDKNKILIWKSLDIEAKWGLRGGKFTSVSNFSSGVLGLVMTAAFFGALYPFHRYYNCQLVDMFFHGGAENRSTIPYFIMFLSFWCLAILLIKIQKIKIQSLALALTFIPEDKGFTLSPMNAADIISGIREQVFRSRDFMLTWRMECVLSNLKNIGKVSDISSILQDLAENDSTFVENSYIMPRGLIWAIPILGFIGTVLGLSQAVGGFGAVAASSNDISMLSDALGGVTGGLAVAFETTLIALVAALVLQLLLTMCRQKEEEFLDDCSSYCHSSLVSKLRMLDVRAEIDDQN